MSKFFTVILLISICVIPAYAQKYTRGYVGVGLGVSYIVNHPEADNPGLGLNLNFLNAGYSIYKGFGINASWNGVGHNTEKDNELGYGLIMVGPMYTVSFSDHLKLDIKSRFGALYLRQEIANPWRALQPDDPLREGGSLKLVEETSRLTWSAGISLREHFARRWMYMVSLDVYNTDNELQPKKQYPVSILMGIGFAF